MTIDRPEELVANVPRYHGVIPVRNAASHRYCWAANGDIAGDALHQTAC
jgi:hypothetical protein